jgi:hypothetical protein
MTKEKPPHDIQQKLHALEEERRGLDPKKDIKRITQIEGEIEAVMAEFDPDYEEG